MSKPLDLTPQQIVNRALKSGDQQQAHNLLNLILAPVDTAHLIESSPPVQRQTLWDLTEPESKGEVLQHLSEEIQSDFLRQMNTIELVAITKFLDDDDQADILQQLPGTVVQEVLEAMNAQDRERLEQVLFYPDDCAGGLMTTDTITIRSDVNIDTTLRYLRLHAELPAMTDSLIVVDRNDLYLGQLALIKLLTSHPQVSVATVMDTRIVPIPAIMPDHEVAQQFERLDLVSAPVVDDQGKLLGRITIDDVVDVIREAADHSLMSLAGLDEEDDAFAPVLKTARRRALWLGINLMTAFLASSVIGLFEATIEKVVALAVLMPIVASMGGIAGSQTLTLMIRGMATGHISSQNSRWLLNRELIVGGLNGLLWAAVVALAAGLWFGDPLLSALIAAAMVINLCLAALAGTLLPLLLKARGIDPALAGGVILTTVTDVMGFMSFLGLATLCYG